MKALVTTDGSPLSLSILDTVHELVALIPAVELHFATVLHPKKARGQLSYPHGEVTAIAVDTVAVRSPLPAVVESHGEAIERVHHEQLEQLDALTAKAFPDVPRECHVLWSEGPAEAIVELAEELDADVIVMATHGRSGMSHLVAGSVTERVIRESGRPVLVRCPRS